MSISAILLSQPPGCSVLHTSNKSRIVKRQYIIRFSVFSLGLIRTGIRDSFDESGRGMDGVEVGLPVMQVGLRVGASV